jgi:hypothetical protein
MSQNTAADDRPVHLYETDVGDRVLIHETSAGVRIELRYEGDALWLTQAQMAGLFGRDVSVISRHITNILEEGELPEEGSLQKVQTTTGGRPGVLYSLDMVISVGYRVSSSQATLFRKWATGILVQFATKGFVVDTTRLKSPGDQDRIAELRETIRDIRASEANVYAELRRICAMCQDYDPKSEAARTFYTRTQAKLFYAVVNHTPSEMLVERASGDAPDMGLQTWPRDDIRQQDALTAKNYLAPGEIQELNRLTNILLDIFEDQVEVGRLTTMAEATELLHRQLQGLGRVVLRSGGTTSHQSAEAHAKAAYKTFDSRRRAARILATEEEIAALKAADRTLPKARASKKPRPSS